MRYRNPAFDQFPKAAFGKFVNGLLGEEIRRGFLLRWPGDEAVRLFLQPTQHLAVVDVSASDEVPDPFRREVLEAEVWIEQREGGDVPVRQFLDRVLTLPAGWRLGAGTMASARRRLHTGRSGVSERGPKDGRYSVKRGVTVRAGSL